VIGGKECGTSVQLDQESTTNVFKHPLCDVKKRWSSFWFSAPTGKCLTSRDSSLRKEVTIGRANTFTPSSVIPFKLSIFRLGRHLELEIIFKRWSSTGQESKSAVTLTETKFGNERNKSRRKAGRGDACWYFKANSRTYI